MFIHLSEKEIKSVSRLYSKLTTNEKLKKKKYHHLLKITHILLSLVYRGISF